MHSICQISYPADLGEEKMVFLTPLATFGQANFTTIHILTSPISDSTASYNLPTTKTSFLTAHFYFRQINGAA